jgi:hypothetical protein
MAEIVHIQRVDKGDLLIKVGKKQKLVCDDERAEFICRILAHHLGFEIIEKHRLKGFYNPDKFQEDRSKTPFKEGFVAKKKIEPNARFLSNKEVKALNKALKMHRSQKQEESHLKKLNEFS